MEGLESSSSARVPFSFSSDVHDATVDSAGNAVPFGVDPRCNVGAFLTQLLSQLRLNEGDSARRAFSFVPGHLLSAVCTLNKAAAAFAAFGSSSAFSFRWQLREPRFGSLPTVTHFTVLYICSNA